MSSKHPSVMDVQLSPEEAEDYFARIHYNGPKEPTTDVLSTLHRCHIQTMPFENLSVYGKEKITLSKEWLFDKIVRRHRGGFCYELNALFSSLLDYIGFKVKKHAASVCSRKTGILGPLFDHLITMVDVEDGLQLSDVGFGDSFWIPLRFTDSPEHQEQPNGIYRIRRDGDYYFLEEKVKIVVDEFGREEMAKEQFFSPNDSSCASRYRFDLTPGKTEDYLEMLEYHQTDLRSPFTHDRICTIAKPWGRVTLSGNKLVTSRYIRDDKVKKESLEIVGGEEEVVKELEQKMGIRREA
ncbi:PREDICTED: arylamine N-acetyltransferase, pineal gland isozyme NAT-10-like [Acropora digitifera]|uniref:arylamine N-acetyltransferase, pineal gland isozyme NAT-10-like n=1 Tax=Acropora digitifera TaxID=70779 RepID=UPI00077B0997|nr:PREDICTED: arylamine N-acetyltransferase, pineal gland isozyme NAT-10-like [Acropora digitifera]